MKLMNKWINGDCLKELPLIEDNSVDLIITSPPYYNLRVYSNDTSDISNSETIDEYLYLMDLCIKECHRVLKPGSKFIIQFEDYNYTLTRNGKRGKEFMAGITNDLFVKNNFELWTEVIWEKYNAQRAMLSDGALWYRNLKNRDTIIAANWGYVFVYKKAGESEKIEGADITLEEWADYANGIWKINNSGIGHTTPFAEELVKRCIKLWSMPQDIVLDPFAGAGTVNYCALQLDRHAIGIELKKEFYDLAIEKRFKGMENKIVLRTKEDVTKMFKREKEKSQENKTEKIVKSVKKERLVL